MRFNKLIVRCIYVSVCVTRRLFRKVNSFLIKMEAFVVDVMKILKIIHLV